MCDSVDHRCAGRNCLTSSCFPRYGTAGYPFVSVRSHCPTAAAIRRERRPSTACTLDRQPSRGADPGAQYCLDYSLGIGAARRYPRDHSGCRSRGTIPRRERCTRLRHFPNYDQSSRAGLSPA